MIPSIEKIKYTNYITYKERESHSPNTNNNEIVKNASKLINNKNIAWLPDFENEYAKWTSCRNDFAALDFKLYAWENGAEIPESIRNFVAFKFEHISTEHTPEMRKIMKINMCCYHFCLLVYLQTGLITKDQINMLYSIFKALKNASIKNPLKFPNILHHGDINRYKLLNSENCPVPGDLLLHMCPGVTAPFHVSIYAGDAEVIEHNDGAECAKGRLMHDEEDRIHILPQQEVALNINAFIQDHKSLWNPDGDTQDINELLRRLKHTKEYEHLITEFKITLENAEGESTLLEYMHLPI